MLYLQLRQPFYFLPCLIDLDLPLVTFFQVSSVRFSDVLLDYQLTFGQDLFDARKQSAHIL